MNELCVILCPWEANSQLQPACAVTFLCFLCASSATCGSVQQCENLWQGRRITSKTQTPILTWSLCSVVLLAVRNSLGYVLSWCLLSKAERISMPLAAVGHVGVLLQRLSDTLLMWCWPVKSLLAASCCIDSLLYSLFLSPLSQYTASGLHNLQHCRAAEAGGPYRWP